MRRFKSARQAQNFLAAAEFIYHHSQLKRHKLPIYVTREIMKSKIDEWKRITGISITRQENN